MSRCKLPLDANQISMPPSISCCRPTNSDANASIFHRRLAIDDRLHPSGVRKKNWPVSGCSCHLETGPARVAKYFGVYALGRHLSDDTNLRGRRTWHRYKCDKTLMACQNQTNAKKKKIVPRHISFFVGLDGVGMEISGRPLVLPLINHRVVCFRETFDKRC